MTRDGQANLVPCYRMRLLHQDSTYKLYLTTITTCSTTCLQYRVLQNICSPRQMCRWTGQILMHKFQSFSFAFKLQHFFCYFPQYTCMKCTMCLLAWFKCLALILESLLIFRNSKCALPPCISIIVRLTVVHCNTWMMTSSLSCSTASCFTTFNFGRTWKQQWNTWSQSFMN